MRNLYTDLAEYTNRQQILVEARSTHASVELAWQFEKNKNNPIKHYRETDLYMFASTRYQRELQLNKIHNWFKYLVKKHNWKKGLDLGGGIGEQTILAFEAGVDKMTFVEVSKSPSLDYAKWRFKKYGVFDKVIFDNENFKVKEDYDFVIAMDVFEHMEKPMPMIRSLAKHTDYLFCNPRGIKYNWLYPQHISDFTIEFYFSNIDLYLYGKEVR